MRKHTCGGGKPSRDCPRCLDDFNRLVTRFGPAGVVELVAADAFRNADVWPNPKKVIAARTFAHDLRKAVTDYLAVPGREGAKA